MESHDLLTFEVVWPLPGSGGFHADALYKSFQRKAASRVPRQVTRLT